MVDGQRGEPGPQRLGQGGAFRRRNPPAAPLLSSSSSQITHPSLQELTSLLPPPLTCCPPRGGQSLKGVGGVTEQASKSRPGRQGCQGPLFSSHPFPQEPPAARMGQPPHGSRTLAPPEAHTHMLTPLTSFPRCILLFHGLGKRGGMGQGQTGRRQQQAPVEIMGAWG